MGKSTTDLNSLSSAMGVNSVYTFEDTGEGCLSFQVPSKSIVLLDINDDTTMSHTNSDGSATYFVFEKNVRYTLEEFGGTLVSGGEIKIEYSGEGFAQYALGQGIERAEAATNGVGISANDSKTFNLPSNVASLQGLHVEDVEVYTRRLATETIGSDEPKGEWCSVGAYDDISVEVSESKHSVTITNDGGGYVYARIIWIV